MPDLKITDKHAFFYRDPLGQWHSAKVFEAQTGLYFECAEKYMMYHKAILFGDHITAQKIMSAVKASEQKSLGREVKGFDPSVWERHRERIVYNGNSLKFTQHPYLLSRLLDTYPQKLVEASPVDLVWGVGLAYDQAEIDDEKNWRGLNLLGKTLTQLRDDIIRAVNDGAPGLYRSA